MKKIIALSITILLVSAALSACSGGTSEETTSSETNSVLSDIQESASFYSASAGLADTAEESTGENTSASDEITTETAAVSNEEDTYSVG